MPDRTFPPGSKDATRDINLIDITVNPSVIKRGKEVTLQLRVRSHEQLSHADRYPLTKNSWVGINGGRMAEIALPPGEHSRRP